MLTNIHFLERKTIRYVKYVRRMMRFHFNEEFQKSPHDFDEFFSNQRCSTFFFLTRMNLSLCIKEVNWVVVYKV
jgi:hypothetical protein